jgi:F-type H+-transporting ATPase subunit epsilon
MNTVSLEIITPERAYAARELTQLDVPARDGRLTVLAHHAPLVCAVRAGEMDTREPDGTRARWTVGPGTLAVEGDAATLLVRFARPAHEPATQSRRPAEAP